MKWEQSINQPSLILDILYFASPDTAESPGKLSKTEEDGEQFVVEELLQLTGASVSTPNLDEGYNHGGKEENSLKVHVRKKMEEDFAFLKSKQ